MKNYSAIVLAAGLGTRLKKLTEDKPKCLMKVGDRSLLDYVVGGIQYMGISDITVVAGYKHELVEEHLKSKYNNVKVARNDQFRLQNLVSFNCGLRGVPEGNGLLVMNADYVFQVNTFDSLKSHLLSEKELSVYVSHDLSGDSSDVMKVRENDKRELAVMSKKLTEFQSIYTGIFSCGKAYLKGLKKNLARLISEVDLQTVTVEALFADYVARGEKVLVGDIGPANWFEVDNEEELIQANKNISKVKLW